MKKWCNKLLNIDFTWFWILFFLLSLIIKIKTNLNIQFIFGLFLLYYVPGSNIFLFLEKEFTKWGWLGKEALKIFLSIIVFSIAEIIFCFVLKQSPATNFNQNLLILLLNIILWLLSLSTKKAISLRGWLSEKKNELQKTDRYIFYILVILVISLVVPIIISPVAENADGFLQAIKSLITTGIYSYNFSQIRPLFSYSVAITYYATGINYFFIYRAMFSALFFFSSWFFLDYTKRHLKTPILIGIGYLSLLASPVIITELNIVRPQIALIVFTIPILILLTDALREKNTLFSLIAVVFSIVILEFHELSAVLLLCSILTFIYCYIDYYFIRLKRKVTLNQIIIGFFVVIPYLYIARNLQYFNQLFGMLEFVKSLLPTTLHWRWWFINNYTTIDGINLGWPGIEALYYYLYNGIIFFGLLVILTLSKIIKRIKFRIFELPSLIYFFIFFGVAEVLPRLGFFFLPNRAWVHIMIAGSLLFVFLLEDLEPFIINTLEKGFIIKTRLVIMASVIIIGSAGVIYTAIFNVHTVFNSELGGAKFINDRTPPNSIILSTQDLDTLVTLYGNRNFVSMQADKKLNKKDFIKLISNTINDLISSQINQNQIEIKEVVLKYINNKLISKSTQFIKSSSSQKPYIDYSSSTPLYFMYSITRANSQNANRAYLGASTDAINKNQYMNMGYPIIYEDGSVLILRIH